MRNETEWSSNTDAPAISCPKTSGSVSKIHLTIAKEIVKEHKDTSILMNADWVFLCKQFCPPSWFLC